FSLFPPSWRSDVTIKEDIAEEIARVYGYNNIQATLFPSYQAATLTVDQKKERELLENLYQSGCDEVMNFTFIGQNLLNKMNLLEDHPYRDMIYLGIPLTDDWAGIRTSLVPGMLKTVAYNVTRKNKRLSLFELGNISLKTSKEMPLEEKRLAIALAGPKQVKSHNTHSADYDFFDLKGVVENVFTCFDTSFTCESAEESWLQPYQQAHILVGDQKVGLMGKVHPVICDQFDIDVNCYLAEIDITALFKLSDKKIIYQEVPRFPSSERDMAFVIDQKVSVQNVFDVIKQENVEILKDVKVFDIYRGENIGADQYSLAINLIFNKGNATLTDKEVDNAFNQVLEALQTKVGAKLR
ncbi:MAG: hypothetical protein MJB14_05605, partial [Spirochaetes bacterium]|nr:hypothetical protein [Spirochaetota bacterium]